MSIIDDMYEYYIKSWGLESSPETRELVRLYFRYTYEYGNRVEDELEDEE